LRATTNINGRAIKECTRHTKSGGVGGREMGEEGKKRRDGGSGDLVVFDIMVVGIVFFVHRGEQINFWQIKVFCTLAFPLPSVV
jgi:hypothetical protein